MSESFDAIYENGVLRPLQPLQLPEQAQVKVIIELPDDAEYHRQLNDLRDKLQIGLEQCNQGQVGPFDAEATKRKLREQLSQEGIQ